jgi:hypothetical protein
MGTAIEQARAAKAVAKTELASVPGVVGIGLTKLGDDYALKVNLREALPHGVRLPDRIAGVRVCVEVVGTIRKQPSRE